MKTGSPWTKVAIIIQTVLFAAGPACAAEDDLVGATANLALGYQKWSAPADLDTEPLGKFDDSGLNAVASINWRWRELDHGVLLFGGDLGFMSNESNIRAPGDIGDLAADIMYLTPSITWSLGGRRSKRLNLEAGAGLYWAEIKEFWNTGYSVAAGTQHFDEISPGGYLGISVDYPLPFKKKAWALNVGARIHYADFGSVEALGANLGDLDGPITTFQVGMKYDW
jgi:hypothetical protein